MLCAIVCSSRFKQKKNVKERERQKRQGETRMVTKRKGANEIWQTLQDKKMQSFKGMNQALTRVPQLVGMSSIH